MESIFSLIPDFDDCKNKHSHYKVFIDEFKDEFEKLIKEMPFVPVVDKNGNHLYACINEIIDDKTEITKENVMSDADFISLMGLTDNYLPIQELRESPSFMSFLYEYSPSKLDIDFDKVKEKCSTDGFVKWPDGRRIQIGWGRVSHPGMPFNGMMLLPTELTLKTTAGGIRLVSKPVDEVRSLMKNVLASDGTLNAEAANRLLESLGYKDGLHLSFTLRLNHRTSAGISLAGRNILDYDSNFNTITGQYYSPQNPTSMDLTADIYIDRTCVEVFIDEGLYSYSMEWHESKPEGLRFWGTNLTVSGLKVDRVESIW